MLSSLTIHTETTIAAISADLLIYAELLEVSGYP